MEPGEAHNASLVGGRPIQAAQYVRMSTEHQRYSTLNQIDAIQEYASRRGIQVVRTYADKGKSGLELKGRPALKQLLQDVVSGTANFSLILVYDVSRWGRFQDSDEAAHYEFVCRQAGVNVQYCAEQFDNDGNPMAALLKSMKRIMAAEYSRELSTKVFFAQRRVASLGYRAGGAAGIGFRRLVVDDVGNQKILLETGQHKIIAAGRTVLVPGPAHEVALIRYMFRASASGKSNLEIASALNKQGKLTPRGNPWSRHTVTAILKNEKYTGTNVWNRRSYKLRQGRVYNPKSDWVRVEGAFQPLISRNLFDKSRQAMLARKAPIPEGELLEGLRRLLNEKGRLTRELIASDKRLHSPICYSDRFGGILNAYERIGYTPTRKFRRPEADQYFRKINEGNALNAAHRLKGMGMTVEFRRTKRSIIVDQEYTIIFMAARSFQYRGGPHYWEMFPRTKAKIDIFAVARMDRENREIANYLLLPRELVQRRSIRMYEGREHPCDIYRSDSLEPLYTALAPGFMDGAPMRERILRAIEEARV